MYESIHRIELQRLKVKFGSYQQQDAQGYYGEGCSPGRQLMVFLLISPHYQSGFALSESAMLIGFVLKHPLASQHLVAFCLLAVDYLSGLKLLPMLTHVVFHVLTKLPLECVASELSVIGWFWRKVLSVDFVPATNAVCNLEGI